MDQLAKVGAHGEAARPLWPTDAPGWTDTSLPEVTVVQNRSDYTFTTCGGYDLPHDWPDGYFGSHWTYNVATPRLLPFVVATDAPNRKDAAVVIAPGGGGRFLAIDQEGLDAAAWLNSIGISAFVLVYRTSKDFNTGVLPSQIMDSQRALSIVRSEAQNLGFNTSRIGFMGFSQGGFLAQAMALLPQRLYAPVDSADDVNWRPDFALPIYGGFGGHVTRDAAVRVPPLFIAVAEDDPCAPVGGVVEMWMDLVTKGGPGSELHVYESGGHGWGTCARAPEVRHADTIPACTWTKSAELFLQNVAFGGMWDARQEQVERWRKKDPVFVREYLAHEDAKQASEEAQRAA